MKTFLSLFVCALIQLCATQQLPSSSCNSSVTTRVVIGGANPTSISGRLGLPLVLTCQVEPELSTALDLSYTWTKNGVIIAGITSNTITYQQLTSGDGGQYRCRALVTLSDSATCITDYSSTLTINTQPTITSVTSTVNVVEGQSIQLSCVPMGYPAPTLEWFKMGAESIILSRQSVYVIQVANLSHSGTYTCRASNQEGQSEDSTIVVVSMYTPPPPTTAPATTTQPATTTTSPPTTTDIVSTTTSPLTTTTVETTQPEIAKTDPTSQGSVDVTVTTRSQPMTSPMTDQSTTTQRDESTTVFTTEAPPTTAPATIQSTTDVASPTTEKSSSNVTEGMIPTSSSTAFYIGIAVISAVSVIFTLLTLLCFSVWICYSYKEVKKEPGLDVEEVMEYEELVDEEETAFQETVDAHSEQQAKKKKKRGKHRKF